MDNFLASPAGAAALNVGLNLLSNAIWSVITKVGPRGSQTVAGQFEIPDINQTELSEHLRTSARSVAELLLGVDEDAAKQLQGFLSYPEVEEVVRQIYVAQYLPDQQSVLPSIRQELRGLLSLHFPQSKEQLEEFTELLFTALSKACEHALQAVCNENILLRHEALPSARHRILHDQLNNIEQLIKLLDPAQRLDIDAILEFEGMYRKQVADRHGFITPPNLDIAKKIPISDLYVVPHFYRFGSRDPHNRSQISLPDFLGQINRTVILGNPGGGKSTLSDMISHMVATRYTDRLVGRRLLTPVHVILRSYGEQKKKEPCSIADYIEIMANSKYQTPAPPKAFEYLFRTGRALVIFDGLDELLEISYRREISEDIESFCNLYTSVPVVVTSRQVGYHQAPLDPRRFRTFVLADFGDEQVEEYAKKWFSTYLDWTAEERNKRTAAFLNESRIVPDLRSNPLMLALMCNIYRGENYIPRNRPDVYEKCANMLFERWDKSRGIRPNLPFEAHLIYAMKYLAHWLYTVDPLLRGVRDVQIIDKATEYLREWLYDDEAVARQAASEFVDFCRGRAWVFTDVGSTPDDRDLYQFTHRTFLEYFAAAHLVRTSATPEKLDSVLRPRIAKREWDVVAQLAFQLLNDRLEGAGDVLLRGLLEGAREAAPDRTSNLLSFAARSLEYLVPKPATVKEIVETILDWVIDQRWRSGSSVGSRRSWRGPVRAELLAALLYVAPDNRSNVEASLVGALVRRVNDQDFERARSAAQIAQYLPSLPRYIPTKQVVQSDASSWISRIRQDIYDKSWNRIRDVGKRDRGLAALLLWEGSLSVNDVYESFGVDFFFRDSHLIPLGTALAPVALTVVERSMSLGRRSGMLGIGRHVGHVKGQELSDLLCAVDPPWIDAADVSQMLEPAFLRRRPAPPVRPDSSVTGQPNKHIEYVTFVTLALLFEITRDRAFFHAALRHPVGVRVPPAARLMMGRSRGKLEDEEEIMNELGFDERQREVVRKWIRRRLSFTRKTVRPRDSEWSDEYVFIVE